MNDAENWKSLGTVRRKKACLLITNSNKAKERKEKALIINAVKEVRHMKKNNYPFVPLEDQTLTYPKYAPV